MLYRQTCRFFLSMKIFFLPFDLLLVNDGAYHFNLYSISIQQILIHEKEFPFLSSSIASETFFCLHTLSIHTKKFCRDNFIDPPSPSLSFSFSHTVRWPMMTFSPLSPSRLTHTICFYCLMLKWPFYLMNYDRWPPTSNIFLLFWSYRLLLLCSLCTYMRIRFNELHADVVKMPKFDCK